MIQIKAPQFPESIADGEVAAWHVEIGESVRRDQVLVDIETDKVVLEVVAPVDGKLMAIYALFKTKCKDKHALANVSELISSDSSYEVRGRSCMVLGASKDPEFLKAGLVTSSLKGKYRIEQKRKLRPRSVVLRDNPWLRLRLALGSNLNTDVLFVMLNGLFDRPTKAADYLGCTRQALYKNWKQIEESGILELSGSLELIRAG